MTINSCIIETDHNRYTIQIVGEEVHPHYPIEGHAEVVELLTKYRSFYPSGKRLKNISLNLGRCRINGEEFGDNGETGTLYAYLIKNSQRYQNARKKTKMLFIPLLSTLGSRKIRKTLEHLVDTLLSSKDLKTDDPTRLGCINVLGSSYVVYLEVQHHKSVSERLCVGTAIALLNSDQGYGGKGPYYDDVKIYSWANGTQYEFTLKFEQEVKRKPTTADHRSVACSLRSGRFPRKCV